MLCEVTWFGPTLFVLDGVTLFQLSGTRSLVNAYVFACILTIEDDFIDSHEGVETLCECNDYSESFTSNIVAQWGN